jgi:hypothetical protein
VSVGVEVDALALMLDGAIGVAGRFDRRSVSNLEVRGEMSSMAWRLRLPGMAAVAEAIFELEGLADCWDADEASCIDDNVFPPWTALSFLAALRADSHMTTSISLREAAALLRDGWRPRGWRAS